MDEVRVYKEDGGGSGVAVGSRPTPRVRDRSRAAKLGPPAGQDVDGDMTARARRVAEADARAHRELGHVAEPDSPAGEGATTVAAAPQALARSADAETHARALEALLDAPAVPLEPVLRLAESTRNPELRDHALEVLAMHGGPGPRVLDLLRALAVGDPDEDVRDHARMLREDAAR